ncbi:penicillin-binding protein 1A [Pontivivens insulae]|uniref:Penicillin-binding protein 1A n=1 Tax=Pontivivens insulae TaxID=1639689 RepID=A0A2R8AB48_9RHOB|nr:PBP1A family penicillin-binding protein [Pontivivens insulae]RED11375.1 penicillin-binding protein 1A [Pontivivens insulae]SPF29452.1 Penicillin-binding protein 1A [Pontivivens insulae]
MRYIGRFFGWIFSALVLASLMGVLVVGGVVWSYSKDLPDTEELADYRPNTLSRVYSGEGRLLDEYVRERRVFVPFDEIPPVVWQAFVSAEDGSFFEHPGFDAVGIVSAGLDAARGGRLRGASTITQQVVKNFLLDGRREVERKIQEVILAVRIESLLTKEQILELYLNEIFLGENSFGIVAAAANYFGKSLEELTPQEAAYLASLPKAPSNRHPVDDAETAMFWRNNTLRLMGEQGYLTPEEVETAQAAPLLSVQGGDYAPLSSTRPGRDYFSEEIRRQMSDRFGTDELLTGGLTIRATVEPDIQEAAAAALRAQLVEYDRDRLGYRGPLDNIAEDLAEEGADWRSALRATRGVRDVPEFHMAVVLELESDAAVIGIEGIADPADGQHRLYVRDFQWARPRLEGTSLGSAPDSPDDILDVGDVILVAEGRNEEGTFTNWNLRQVPELNGAFMVMDHRTGRVLAMQGGFSYDASSFNRATQATRQPGSAFKPFVFAAALDAGMTPNSIILDAPFVLEQPGQPTWRPKNYSGADSFNGPTLMRVGLERSLNLMTVRIADDIGMDVIADYAEDFGIYEDMGEFLPMSLGAGETTLFRMISAYAMFANGGQRVEPTLVDRVQDRFGNTIYRHDQRGCEGCDDSTYSQQPEPHIYSTAERTMSRITAFRLISMLEGVVDRGTARSLADLPVPLAGKTGTTNESRDAWFIGFTPDIVAGCYIGFDTPRGMGRGGTGGSMCGPVFRAFMEDYLEINPADPGRFQPPEGVDVIKMDRTSGARLPDDTTSGDWVYEVFPLGEAPAVGAAAIQRGVSSSGSGRTFDLNDLPATVANDIYIPPTTTGTVAVPGANAGGGAVTVAPIPAPPADLDDLGSGGLY